MRCLPVAALAAISLFAQPALAQSKGQPAGPAQPSPLARQAMAGDPPDVLLDVPNLSVDELTVDVANLDVKIALDAQLANLLKLSAGADAHVDQVKIGLKGVKAQATLIVRLDNVKAIIDRTLQTLDKNPQIVQGLFSTVDNTVGTVGGVANNAVGTVGGLTASLLRNGQVLDLAKSGLTLVNKSVNAAGQTVSRVSRNGQVIDVVTDSAGRILSSTPVTAR